MLFLFFGSWFCGGKHRETSDEKEWDAEVLWDGTETRYHDACYL